LPRAKGPKVDGRTFRADLSSYYLGGSLIFLASPTFNVFLWSDGFKLSTVSDQNLKTRVATGSTVTDPLKKRCELHLRNSWGEGAAYNGWQNANTILIKANHLVYMDSPAGLNQ
jgi:hypothetical protein